MSGYEDILQQVKYAQFMAPDGSNQAQLVALISKAVDVLIKNHGDGPIYPREGQKPTIGELIAYGVIPESTTDVTALLETLPQNLAGSVKSYSPHMVKNVIAAPSFMHIAVYVAASLLMPNGVTGEDAGDILNAEIMAAAAMARLAGYDPINSGGLFTFGGTGTNLYAFKLGLTKAQPNHISEGLDGNSVILGSWPAHYCHQSAAVWLGLGQKNYIAVASNTDQTTNLADFEQKCEEVLSAGKKIACIVGAGGTTSNMGIDDFSKIVDLRQRLIEKHCLGYKPHIHADAVIGWAYLNFVDYDLEQNPLRFSPAVLDKIKRIVERISTLKYADSFGVDFHKTGYMPYVSSMIIARSKIDLATLGRDSKIMTPLFHDESAYNPGKFTLETSRSAANILATWFTLTALGKDGMRALLGNALEVSEHIRTKVDSYKNLGFRVVNDVSYGSDTFIRCYPPGVDADQAFAKELIDPAILKRHTDYTSDFFSWLSSNQTNTTSDFSVSKTSAAFYTAAGKPVVALRIYVLNPYISKDEAELILTRLAEAKKAFDASRSRQLSHQYTKEK